ncbi:hypothetical protein HF086_013593 [Spodoptera exigua]|uniref:Gustatory receptor n=1 Tax=Spodoptera exigua TaxID=7107 RepID=A0A922MUG8_SPOEX|nr:hypothetical protein HF086_013593 [Spodoptera exigua]
MINVQFPGNSINVITCTILNLFHSLTASSDINITSIQKKMWDIAIQSQISSYSNNRLDNNIYKTIQPFNLIFTLFVSSKFKIRNRYIFPCDKIYQIVIFIVNIFFFTWSLCNVISFTLNDNVKYGDKIYCLSIIFSSAFYFIDYLILIIDNLFYSHTNIALIMKIQDITRAIDINKSFRSYINWNFISLFISLAISLLTIIWFLNFYISFADVSIDIMIVVFDVNLIYGIRILVLFNKYFGVWIESVYKMDNQQNNEEDCNKLVKLYRDILEAYKLFIAIFTVLHNYTIIATLIVGLDWMIKNIIIISAICMQCEKFQMHIEEAESACIQLVMKRDCPSKDFDSLKPESNKYLYKRVLQYNHLFTKMSAYGFFTFDAKLPMPLSSFSFEFCTVCRNGMGKGFFYFYRFFLGK